MNIEQELAAFEALFPMPADCQWCGNGYAPTEFNAWYAQAYAHKWHGFKAALQSQDREDAERLNWLESLGSVDIVKTLEGKTEVFAPDDDMIYATGAELREAIDHARRVEGDGE